MPLLKAKAVKWIPNAVFVRKYKCRWQLQLIWIYSNHRIFSVNYHYFVDPGGMLLTFYLQLENFSVQFSTYSKTTTTTFCKVFSKDPLVLQRF